jgi:D-sedoheptulose 7-phosphate isomerase
MKDLIVSALRAHQAAISQIEEGLLPVIEIAATQIVECFRRDNRVFLCGNGGSAADAQHIAAEFVGRYHRERRSLPAIALSTDTSALTAIGNDYGFDSVFGRQLEGLGRPGDVLIAITTSGNSANILRAIDSARKVGIYSIGLLGGYGGTAKSRVDLPLVVPSASVARIQEAHILIGHIICAAVDASFDEHP